MPQCAGRDPKIVVRNDNARLPQAGLELSVFSANLVIRRNNNHRLQALKESIESLLTPLPFLRAEVNLPDRNK